MHLDKSGHGAELIFLESMMYNGYSRQTYADEQKGVLDLYPHERVIESLCNKKVMRKYPFYEVLISIMDLADDPFVLTKNGNTIFHNYLTCTISTENINNVWVYLFKKKGFDLEAKNKDGVSLIR